MGILAIDKRVRCELLDQRGNVVLSSRGGHALKGTLREVPATFERGAPIAMFIVSGDSRFEASCRIVDGDRAVLPGAQIYVDILKAGPADISKIEPFDMVPDSMSGPAVQAPPTPPFGVSAVSAEGLVGEEEDEPTGVVGTLKEMPIAEVVQSLQQNRKDALVEVRAKDREHGTLGVVAGRLVYARTATRVGDAAFFELLGATRGAFRIRYGRKPDVTNIIRDTGFLILEGMRLLDEEVRNGAAPIVVEAPSMSNKPKPPAPSTVTPSGKFAKFFDEAGVTTPPHGNPSEGVLQDVEQRFSSIMIRSLEGDLYDIDAPESQSTTKTKIDKKRRKKKSGEKSDPTYP